MGIQNKLEHALNTNVYHGGPILAGANRSCSKTLWLSTILAVTGSMVLVLTTMTRQFYIGQSIVATSTQSPTRFPILNICPVNIPTEAAVAAGYSPFLADWLNELLENNGHLESKETERDDRKDLAVSEAGGKNVQDVLFDIGTQHLDMLQASVNLSFIRLNVYQAKTGISLSSDGYCFSIMQQGITELAARIVRFMQLTVGFKNESMVEHSGGFRISLTSQPTDPIVPPVQSLPAHRYINFVAKWYIRETRNTKQKSCNESNTAKHSCIAECTEKLSYSCNGAVCKKYSYARNQTFASICPLSMSGSESCQLVEGHQDKCHQNCKRPCKDAAFRYSFTVPQFDVAQYGYHQMLVGGLQAVDGSMHYEESPKVTWSMFISFLGGDMGCYLGFNIFAFAVITKAFLLKRVLPRKNKRRTYLTKKLSQVMIWSLVFGMALPYFRSLFETFTQKMTTSVMRLNAIAPFPKILIITTWVDVEKMNTVLQVSPEFLAEEDDRVRQGNFTLPFLCNLIYGLPVGSTLLDSWDDQIPGYWDHIKKLEKIIEFSPFVKEHGVAELLKLVTADIAHRIHGVTNGYGQQIDYTTGLTSTGAGYLYTIIVNTSSQTMFVNSRSGITIRLARNLPGDQKCLRAAYPRVLLFRNYESGMGMNSDYITFDRDLDTNVRIRAQSIKAKNTPSKPCIEGVADNSECYAEFFDKHQPCQCQALHYGEPEAAMVMNVSAMCHRLKPVFQQCQAVRMLDVDLQRTCSHHCAPECDRTFYHAEMSQSPAEDNETMAITIHMESETNHYHVEEFFVYDIFRFFCALASIFMWAYDLIFFGYSFISAADGAHFIWVKI